MAYTVRNLKDTDFETVVHVTITGTNGTATEIVDASGLAGASTDPRLSIVSCTWSVSSTLEVEFHATSNVTALTVIVFTPSVKATGFPRKTLPLDTVL